MKILQPERMYTPGFISEGIHREMLACLPILIHQLLIGIGWGWTAPSILKFQGPDSPLPLTTEQVSWIVSIHEFGRMSSPFISPLIVDNIGRRYSIVMVVTMTVLIWLSQIFIRNFVLLCATRLAFGLTTGLIDVVSPIYVTENCSATLRRVNAGLVAALFCVGKCLETTLNAYLTYEMTAMANTMIAMGACGALYFCVETPQFLIMKGRYSEAEDVLKWLRGDSNTDEVAKQFQELKEYVRKEKEKRASIRSLLSSAENVKSLLVVLGIYLISTTVAGAGVGSYSVMIFVPTETLSLYNFMLMSDICSFLGLSISTFLNARIETRKLMIVAYVGMSAAMGSIGTLIYFHNRGYEMAQYPWLIFLALQLCNLTRSPTGPGQYVLRGELLPLSVRSLGGSACVVISGAVSFCVIQAFLPIADNFGMEANFFLYALVCLLMPPLIYFCVPKAPREPVATA